jgi:hypothetical protein
MSGKSTNGKPKRSKVVKLRFSDAEFQHLEKIVPDGCRMASWSRLCLLGQSPPRVPKTVLSAEARMLAAEIARVGNNLNQLAKLGNRTALVDPERLPEVFSRMTTLTHIAEALESLERRFL